MKKSILSAKEISKSFAHNGMQQHILSQLDFDLYEGDFTVIMGASGSGKSTLLYALSGMDKATAGVVRYKEKDLVKLGEKELATLRHTDFGFIFQQMHLIGNLSLFENVAVCGYLNKTAGVKEVRKRTDELLVRMGLEKVKTHLPSQVSGGEQQRCAIARAVVNTPKILFADEPTASLDHENAFNVMKILKKYSEKRLVIVVTHDRSVLSDVDILVEMWDGKLSSIEPERDMVQ